MNVSDIRIVLVNTTHPGNIGAVARAMKNMGLRELCLVQPARFPAPEASWRAAGAADLLRGATVVDTLAEAVGSYQLVIGSSARDRRIPWPVLDPRRCAERAVSACAAGAKVALVFGREDRGLTNAELQACHLHLQVPTHEDYPSLNLAMAVQIVAWELRMLSLGTDLPSAAEREAPFVTAADMERYYAHLEQALIEIGFLDPAAPRQLMARLRRLYGRVQLDEMELNILRGMLTETQNSLRR